MSPPSLFFLYGIELNSTLLHCLVAGPKPSCQARAQLLGHQLTWTAAGHLPNLSRHPDGLVEGILVRFSPAQRQRLEAARLVPVLYQWRTVTVLTDAQRRRRALCLQAPAEPALASPPGTLWRELVVGALEQGLRPSYIEQLLALRPNDPFPGLRCGAGEDRRAA